MAYSDYSAIVLKNGVRRADKEDVPIFTDLDNICSKWLASIHHGVVGDGNIRAICHKQHIPEIYEISDGTIIKIEIPDCFINYTEEYVENFQYEYKDYKFNFNHGDYYDNKFNEFTMIEPDGTIWSCIYGYGCNL